MALFIYRLYQLLPMSGTNNPYDPTEIYKKWLEQNQKLHDNFQEGFDRVTRQMNDIQKMSEAWSRVGEQMDAFAKQSPLPNMEGMFAEMMKSAMLPWQRQPGFLSMPNMLVNWAAFKTNVGSNGRISIPEAERNAMGLNEGDLVQVIVLPVSKKKEVKK